MPCGSGFTTASSERNAGSLSKISFLFVLIFPDSISLTGCVLTWALAWVSFGIPVRFVGAIKKKLRHENTSSASPALKGLNLRVGRAVYGVVANALSISLEPEILPTPLDSPFLRILWSNNLTEVCVDLLISKFVWTY